MLARHNVSVTNFSSNEITLRLDPVQPPSSTLYADY